MTSLWKQRYLANQRDKTQQFQSAETFDFRRNDEALRELRLANIKARNAKHLPVDASPPPPLEESAPPEPLAQPETAQLDEPAAPAAELPEHSPDRLLEDDLPGYPAPPAVTGDSELIERLRSYFAEYLSCSDAQLTILAFWALHTHCFVNFPVTPYLEIASVENQSGKTRCLQLLSYVCENPWPASGVSGPVLMRKVMDDNPTVLLDDWHTAFRSVDRQSITGFLIAGYRQSNFYSVYRPQAGHTEEVTVFCPKAFSGAEPLPPALSHLCIRILLRRQKPEDYKPWRNLLVMRGSMPLRRYMRRWSEQNRVQLSWSLTFDSYAESIAELLPRQKEMADVFLALAHLIGGHWPDKVRDALVSILSEKKITDRDQLLLDIKAAFASSENSSHLGTWELLGHLHGAEHGRWKTCSKGKPMTPRRLSDMLREFGIRPGNPHKGPDSSHRGYDYHNFIEHWDKLSAENAS